jgi:hypothetical protein
MRVAMGGGDVVRRRLREERSEGWKSISGGRAYMVEVVGAVQRAARGARVHGAHRDVVVRQGGRQEQLQLQRWPPARPYER